MRRREVVWVYILILWGKIGEYHVKMEYIHLQGVQVYQEWQMFQHLFSIQAAKALHHKGLLKAWTWLQTQIPAALGLTWWLLTLDSPAVRSQKT